MWWLLIGDMDESNVICSVGECGGDGCLEIVGEVVLRCRLNWFRLVRRSWLSCCARRQCSIAVVLVVFGGDGVGSMAGAAHLSDGVEAAGLGGEGVCESVGGWAGV